MQIKAYKRKICSQLSLNFSFQCFCWIRIRLKGYVYRSSHTFDTDPDTGKWYGIRRIRIRNTVLNFNHSWTDLVMILSCWFGVEKSNFTWPVGEMSQFLTLFPGERQECGSDPEFWPTLNPDPDSRIMLSILKKMLEICLATIF